MEHKIGCEESLHKGVIFMVCLKECIGIYQALNLRKKSISDGRKSIGKDYEMAGSENGKKFLYRNIGYGILGGKQL